ncbi:hypothetical protein [Cellulophaga sp. HaHa_2_1]|uniref:hypothetical protein n=1 Tax=Cellulophaga sp. HaHa_2_1 TaxID=2749994 RepID=UPI001C4F9BE9|nr:hypothetical protein [Cellulophaga sp. HaHa_2_1]QXP53215.1 hypothetical protein H0I24_04575 [Cellulophaga sp. HaHa_2_1]
MSRDRELTMEIEVAGRSYKNQKEKLALTPWPSARPIFHFRRWEVSWNDFMKGDFDGFHETREDDFKYGFDWLGDDYYDFGKTDDLNKRAGRYNYIYNDVFNSIEDPGGSGKKVTIVMEDKNIESNESLDTAIDKYKAIFQKDAKLTTLYKKDYFPSWVTIRQGKTVSLLVGYRNDDVTVGPQFGDNDDSFHVVAEPGYENHFEISAPEIKKEDLDSNGLPLDITCKNVINRDVSILVYHTDNCTIKSPDGTIDLAKNGTLVGELRVMKNNIKYMLDVVLVRVQRIHTNDFAAKTSDDLVKLKKIMSRTFAQGLIDCDFSEQMLPNCLDALSYSISRNDGTIDHVNYLEYINNKFLYEEYKNSLDNSVNAVSFNRFKNNSNNVKSNFKGSNKQRFILFLHDYNNTQDGIQGIADDIEDDLKMSNKGKWAVIYNNGNNNFHAALHETAHTMGLAHTFNSYKRQKANCIDPTISRNTFTSVNIFPLNFDAYYFKKKRNSNKFLFRQAYTENIMDYTGFFVYQSIEYIDFLTEEPPVNTNHYDVANKKRYKAEEKERYFQIPKENEKNVTYQTTSDKLSFYKWQWELLQNDDETVRRNMIMKVQKVKLTN